MFRGTPLALMNVVGEVAWHSRNSRCLSCTLAQGSSREEKRSVALALLLVFTPCRRLACQKDSNSQGRGPKYLPGPALCACAKQPGSGTLAPRCLPLLWSDRVAGHLLATHKETARGGGPSAQEAEVPTPPLEPRLHTLPLGLVLPLFSSAAAFAMSVGCCLPLRRCRCCALAAGPPL